MSDQSVPSKTPQVMGGRWCSPIDATVYDRFPRLYTHEITELEAMTRRERFGCWAQRIKEALARLRRPVQDALKVAEVPVSKQCTCVTVLLLEMHRRQTTFWVWNPAEWVETLCTSPQEFCQRHGLVRDEFRHLLAAAAYLLDCFRDVTALGIIDRVVLARHVFGRSTVNRAISQVGDLITGWGYGANQARILRTTLGVLFLANQSPELRDLTVPFLEEQRRLSPTKHHSAGVLTLSRVLLTLGFTGRALPYFPETGCPKPVGDVRNGVRPEWMEWVERWFSTTTLQRRTRCNWRRHLFKAGRWLAAEHPDCTSPDHWTREIAADWVAAVCRMTVGEWMQADAKYQKRIGKPLAPSSKGNHLNALAAFFRDCQEWEWIGRRFDPRRCFSTPPSVRKLIAPNPRIIADDVWAKLLWAGLNLEARDLPVKPGQKCHVYPIEIVRAVSIVWLFCGLRMDEIRRLRIGCVLEWKDPAAPAVVCNFSVPASKTSPSFSKPVDRLVGEAVRAWEAVRPPQPLTVDEKTGELVELLFMYRGQRMGYRYINETLIGILCNKAGIPRADARGNITSHRARSTIASQLFNAKEPMSLLELQRWLGHKWVYSTQFYLQISATKLANSYRNAEYFARNVRAIEVLIDRDVITSGKAADQPWKFYDLGNGYCTYDFFDQCPHRMACAKCSFYLPKASTQAQLLEGKANLLRMRQEIPLKEDELVAIDDGVAAFEKLLSQLADVPTPAGPTPRQLQTSGLVKLEVGPVPTRNQESHQNAARLG
jgi:integrase